MHVIKCELPISSIEEIPMLINIVFLNMYDGTLGLWYGVDDQ